MTLVPALNFLVLVGTYVAGKFFDSFSCSVLFGVGGNIQVGCGKYCAGKFLLLLPILPELSCAILDDLFLHC